MTFQRLVLLSREQHYTSDRRDRTGTVKARSWSITCRIAKTRRTAAPWKCGAPSKPMARSIPSREGGGGTRTIEIAAEMKSELPSMKNEEVKRLFQFSTRIHLRKTDILKTDTSLREDRTTGSITLKQEKNMPKLPPSWHMIQKMTKKDGWTSILKD